MATPYALIPIVAAFGTMVFPSADRTAASVQPEYADKSTWADAVRIQNFLHVTQYTNPADTR